MGPSGTFFLKKEMIQISVPNSCELGFNLVAMRLSDHVKMNSFLNIQRFFFEIA